MINLDSKLEGKEITNYEKRSNKNTSLKKEEDSK